ncbi:SufD family Fe-S cluster assembly protein [Candidatus Parcubacteria bacterium]|nr:SufD family Fe-S cluster assembly protein [Candidatus Parcubacteria bacterium]
MKFEFDSKLKIENSKFKNPVYPTLRFAADGPEVFLPPAAMTKLGRGIIPGAAGTLIIPSSDRFAALHYRHLGEVTVLNIKAGERKTDPLRIAPKSPVSHLVIRLGRNAEATVVEMPDSFGVASRYTEIILEAGAILRLVALRQNEGGSCRVERKLSSVGTNAKLSYEWAISGGSHSYFAFDADLTGRGSRADLAGAFLLRDGEMILHSKVHHRAPETASRNESRGVVQSGGRAVFRGMIKIDRAARGADAHLSQRTLLIGDQAFAKSLPELEIDQSDVKAGHAATVSTLDEEVMFYLATRGIGRTHAEKLVADGFLNSLVEYFPQPQVVREMFGLVEPHHSNVLIH